VSAERLELGVVRVARYTLCLGETVKVRLFARLRQGSAEPVADAP
jgi:hypothetical protein